MERLVPSGAKKVLQSCGQVVVLTWCTWKSIADYAGPPTARCGKRCCPAEVNEIRDHLPFAALQMSALLCAAPCGPALPRDRSALGVPRPAPGTSGSGMKAVKARAVAGWE
eukprot:Skav231249  [mRNA]  locus=scaffold411:417353:420995:- [translate_table: standard]